MSVTVLELSSGGRSKIIRVEGDHVLIGRSAGCQLRLPFPCIQDRHAEIRVDAGFIRVRTCDGSAAVQLNRQPLSQNWSILRLEDVLRLPSPDGATIEIRVGYQSAVGRGGVVEEQEPVQVAAHATRPEIAGVSAIDESQGLFPTQDTSATQASAPKKPRRRALSEHHRLLLCASCLLIMALLVIGAAIVKDTWHRRTAEAIAADVQTIETQIERAQEQIRVGQYVAARQLLEETRQLAEARGQAEQYGVRLTAILERPEIRFGANGYQLLDGKWYPLDLVMSERAARERNGPRVSELQRQAETALAANQLEQGKQYCDEALALLASQPIQPALATEPITLLRTQIQNRIVADDMKAKGFVLVADRWVTPEEKYRLDQIDLGMVQYRGKWMPKEEAFAAEQRDKGLTLVNGKWLTAEEKLIADGYVLFEGQWIRDEERKKITDERVRVARAEEVRREAERRRLEAAAAARAAQTVQQEELKRQAYGMSQTLIRPHIQRGQPRFPRYEDRAVMVVMDDSWYLVKAYVDIADRAGGGTTRRVYVCRLRPGNDGQWETDAVGFVDDAP